MAESYISLEEAAKFEGVSYDIIKKKIQRNPEEFKTKTDQSQNGGKPRILVSLVSLSKRLEWRTKKL
ncbi:hypothetical protein WDD9_005606 [Paenibacillus melissococcoides]|uniref:hypothetical protein n=1 Tax=Paenibacillus melissococcoides TaxID=2912268 RepID=UPI0021C4A94A|nr:hypothetical protein [Paenibacillus melissococcoides]CAH8719593.1 hypothetical protein WDD9_005606 [Paenibacillus melissococcoides]